MWQQQYSTLTDLPSVQLWAAISDVANWAVWHEEIEFTQIEGSIVSGCEFLLKPKGAPAVNLKVEELVPPKRFVDVTQFPLAQMRTIHEFIDTPAGTEIQITVQVWGILGLLWQKIVGQQQVDGLPNQTQRFIQYARQLGIKRSPDLQRY
jgi:hypothetical protein